MQKGVVYKDESFWCGHPDVTYFNGYFYVVFRKSKQHRELDKTKIMLCRSKSGLKYFNPIVVLESNDRLNCPRLSVIGGKIWIICDVIKSGNNFTESENNESGTSIILLNSSDGIIWSYPIITNIKGIVPDRICSIGNEYLIAAHTFDKTNSRLIQNVWKSSSLSDNWRRIELANVAGHNPCEASIISSKNELVCLMRENSGRGDPLLWSYSLNGGELWSAPKKTNVFGGHRPVCGKLKSGNYLVTYREQSFYHHPPYWAKNTFACLIDEKSFHDRNNPCNKAIILPLDHDHGKRSDSGYTGFVETEDNQVYIVNYITKDRARPYIVWYLIDEKEF